MVIGTAYWLSKLVDNALIGQNYCYIQCLCQSIQCRRQGLKFLKWWEEQLACTYAVVIGGKHH